MNYFKNNNWDKVIILMLIMSFIGIFRLPNRRESELNNLDNNVNEVIDDNGDVNNVESRDSETEVIVNSMVDATGMLSY